VQSQADNELGKQLVDLGSEMESVRLLVEDDYEDVRKFVTPGMTPFKDWSGNKPPREPIYDSTAVKANRRMGNGLLGFTMSPTTRFFLFGVFHTTGEPINASDLPGVAHWLRIAEDCIYGVLARSNFYQQAAEVARMAGAYGAPTLWCEPPRFDGDEWSFMLQHPKSIWFSENDRKQVDNHRRRLWMQGKDALRLWGNTLGAEHALVKEWNQAPEKKFTIYHQTFPNDEFDPQSLSRTKKKLRSVYFNSDGTIIENGGLDFSRYLTWRWQVESDQVYPGSISMDAMADIKTLQQMRKTLMEVAQGVAEGPVNAPESMRGKVRLVPRGINYYDKPDQVITRINVGGNYPVALEDYKYAVSNVDDYYFGNLWLMLERQPASARLTAYQVSQMIGEKAAVLGPVVASQNSEFGDPLISMIFNEEMRKGRIPMPPASLRSMMGSGGKGVKLIPHYIGPLAMAQRRNGIMDGFMTALSAITPIAQIRQEVLDHLDFDKWVRLAVISSGAAEEVINGMDQVVQIRQGRMQAAQMQQQQAMQMELVKNFKGLSATPGAGSPGQGIAKALGLSQPEQAVAG
jgi:hypothetical protein